MVALVQTLTGKPLALGGIYKDEIFGVQWDQIVEHSNGSPSTETLKHFAMFLELDPLK